MADGWWAGPGLVLGRWPEPGNRPDQSLRLSRRLALGSRVDPGGGLVLGVHAAIGTGSLLGERRDHCGDRPVFKVS